MTAPQYDKNTPGTLFTALKEFLPRKQPNATGKVHGIVLVLGGGGARGLAHIGVLQVLAENAIPVRAIAGTSIGAEIGAFVASGMSLIELTRIATEFDWMETLQLFMPDWPGGGLVSGKYIIAFLERHLGAYQIENLTLPYIAIATDLETGAQIIIDTGRLADAVRASISIPGVMAPHIVGHRRLIDGSVVNPLPFDVARDRFGGPVVAVTVDNASQHPHQQTEHTQRPERMRQLLKHPWMQRAPMLRNWLEGQINNHDKQPKSPWSLRRVIDRATDIRQQHIIDLRAKLSPPDLIITPNVSHIGMLEFYEATSAITAGREAALAQLPALRELLEGQRTTTGNSHFSAPNSPV